MGLEGDGPHPIKAIDTVLERGLDLGLHEWSEHDQSLLFGSLGAFVGRQGPVDQHITIAPATGGDEHKGLIDGFRQLCFRAQRWHRALEISGVDDLATHRVRHVDLDERIMNLRQAIDPDLVVEIAQGRDGVLALPLRLEELRVIHDVSQTENDPGAAILEHVDRFANLAPQSEGFLVDEEDVGIKDVGGMPHDGRAQRHGLLDTEHWIERRVLSVAQLDDTRNAHEVHPRTKIETANDGKARKYEDREVVDGPHHGMGDGSTAAQMPQSETVMAVDQNAGAFRNLDHDAPVCFPKRHASCHIHRPDVTGYMPASVATGSPEPSHPSS